MTLVFALEAVFSNRSQIPFRAIIGIRKKNFSRHFLQRFLAKDMFGPYIQHFKNIFIEKESIKWTL